ncbi:hypothetical protein MHBO_004617, partial [Bonamia ostreae]
MNKRRSDTFVKEFFKLIEELLERDGIVQPQTLDGLEDLSNAPISYIYDQVKESTSIKNEETFNNYPVVDEAEITTNRDKTQQEKPEPLIELASKTGSTLDKVQSIKKEQKKED